MMRVIAGINRGGDDAPSLVSLWFALSLPTALPT